MSAFLEKGGKGYCVCEKKVVILQSLCALARLAKVYVKTISTIEETIKTIQDIHRK